MNKEEQNAMYREQFKPAIRYMERHFRENPALPLLAAKSCMSQFHFCRTFSRVMGESPKGYIDRLRVADAKRLLANTRLSLPEIARRLGFAHQSHFTSRFKQLTGETPGARRRGPKLERSGS